MAGNVEQWCADWHGPYAAAEEVDPSGAADGRYRVYRGGSWLSHPYYMRAAVRESPDYRSHGLGFRPGRTE